MQIEVGEFQVEVIKKQIKNLHLSVLPPDGRIRVSAPKDMSDDSIRLFILSNKSWIETQQQVFDEQLRQSKRQFVSGETFFVWGKPYYLVLKYSKKCNSLQLVGNKAILTVRQPSTVKQRENYVNEWYRIQLKDEIEKLLPKWEEKTGLYCDSWQTKYMITKWGTCSIEKRKLWFNLQLAKKPIECLEYIILHELAHLKEAHHDANFVAILNKYMPYWRETKKLLNDSVLDFLE